MAHEQHAVQTRDGACPLHVFTPSNGAGPWPAAIFYMDGLGIRPNLFEMAQRLADGGYLVLLPDMYYRAGPYPPMDPAKVLASPDAMSVIGPMIATTNTHKAAQDTRAFLDYLDTRKDVAGKKVGVFGYCMGGGLALTAAGTYPDRIAAAASFHGGNLANDTELSPHLVAPKIKGRVYLAVADNDPYYPPEMGERFDKTLRDAGVQFRSELYPGALHGWTMKDFPIYNEEAGEKHWRELLTLFNETLR